MNLTPNLVSAYHETGHVVALLAAGHERSDIPLPAKFYRSTVGKPWYAPAQFFDWQFPPDAKKRIEAMRNTVQHYGIIAMAGPVAEAQQTGKRLTAALESIAGIDDDRYLHTIGHKLYGRDFGRFRADALAAADEILSMRPWDGMLSHVEDTFPKVRQSGSLSIALT